MNTLLFSNFQINALGNIQSSQEHLKRIVYAKFGGNWGGGGGGEETNRVNFGDLRIEDFVTIGMYSFQQQCVCVSR